MADLTCSLGQVIGDSVLTSVRITWADGIDYFVEELINNGHWRTTSSGNSIDYWPGVADDPAINQLSDFSSRVTFSNVLDLENRLSSMRQGVSPRVFCGPVSNQDDERVSASAYVDQITGGACNMSQIDAPDSTCCLSDFHTIVQMSYLVEGGFYPPPSSTKWGTFDGFMFSAPPIALCEAGTAFNSTSESCSSCESGSFASGTEERFECTLCSAGTYAPGPGMPECLACDSGYYADKPGQTECSKCPKGATCDDGVRFIVKKDYWRLPGSIEMFSCPLNEACAVGGNCSAGFEGVLLLVFFLLLCAAPPTPNLMRFH